MKVLVEGTLRKFVKNLFSVLLILSQKYAAHGTTTESTQLKVTLPEGLYIYTKSQCSIFLLEVSENIWSRGKGKGEGKIMELLSLNRVEFFFLVNSML